MAEGGLELSAQTKQQIHILKKPQNRRTADDLNKLGATFKYIRFFKDLEASVRTQVCRGLKLEHFAAGATIFNEGDSGDQFYIILAGSVGVYIKEVQAQDVDVEGEDEEKPSRISFGKTKTQDVITYDADEEEGVRRGSVTCLALGRNSTPVPAEKVSKGGEETTVSRQISEESECTVPGQPETSLESQTQPSSVARRRTKRFTVEGSEQAAKAVRQTLRTSNRSSMLSFMSTDRRRSRDSYQSSRRGSTTSSAVGNNGETSQNYKPLGESGLSRAGSKETRSSGEADSEDSKQIIKPRRASRQMSASKVALPKLAQVLHKSPDIVSKRSSTLSMQSKLSIQSLQSTQNGPLILPNVAEASEKLSASPQSNDSQDSKVSKSMSRRYSNAHAGDLANQAKLAAASLKSCLKNNDTKSDAVDWLESMAPSISGTHQAVPSPRPKRISDSKRRTSSTESTEMQLPEDLRPTTSETNDMMAAILEEGEEIELVNAPTDQSNVEKKSTSDSESSNSQPVDLPALMQNVQSVHSSEACTPASSRDASDIDQSDLQIPEREFTSREAFRLSVGTAAMTFLAKQLTLLAEKIKSNPSGASNSSSDSFGSSSSSGSEDEDWSDPLPKSGSGTPGPIRSASKFSSLVSQAVDASDMDGTPSHRGSVTSSKISPLAKRFQRVVRKQSWTALLPKMQEVAVLQAGSAFGEVALQTNQLRSATIRTKEESYLASLTRDDYLSILQSHFEKQQNDRKEFLMTLPLIQDIHPSGFQKICALMVPRTLHKNECVYKVGEQILQIYCAKEGEFEVCHSVRSSCMDAKDDDTTLVKPRASTSISSPRHESLEKLEFITTSLLNPPCVFGLAPYLMGERRYRHKVVCCTVVGVVYCILAKELVHYLSREHREHLHASACAEEQFAQNRIQVLKHLHAPLERRYGCSYGRRRVRAEETVVQKLQLVRGDIQRDFSAYSFEGRLRTIGKVFTGSHGKYDGTSNTYSKHLDEDSDVEDTPSKVVPRNPQLQVMWWMQKIVASHPDAINPRYEHLLRMKHTLPMDVDGPVSSIPVYVKPALTDYRALAKASWQNPRLAAAFDSNCFHAPTLERQPRGRADGTVEMVRRAPVDLQLQPNRTRSGRVVADSTSPEATSPQREELESYTSSPSLPRLAPQNIEMDVPYLSVSPLPNSPTEMQGPAKIQLPQIVRKATLPSIFQSLEDQSYSGLYYSAGSPVTECQSSCLGSSPMSCRDPADFFAEHLVASLVERGGCLAAPLPAGQDFSNGASVKMIHQGSAASLLTNSCNTCSTTSLHTRCTVDSSRSDVSTMTSVNLDQIYKKGSSTKIRLLPESPVGSPSRRAPRHLPYYMVDFLS